mgnify:CR=1 FL=1
MTSLREAHSNVQAGIKLAPARLPLAAKIMQVARRTKEKRPFFLPPRPGLTKKKSPRPRKQTLDRLQQGPLFQEGKNIFEERNFFFEERKKIFALSKRRYTFGIGFTETILTRFYQFKFVFTMANINDLISQAVNAAASSVEIPSNVKSTVLNGLSSSILGSLTQTATKKGGVDQLKGLLTGATSAASSPVTALASQLFTSNVLSKLNLGGTLNNALTGLIPTVLGKLGGILKDQDGDGDIDFNDILITLKGGSSSTSSSVLGAATSVLGSIFKKK